MAGYFSRDRAEADRVVSMVVNQMMVDAFGWENPIGKQVHMNDTIHVYGHRGGQGLLSQWNVGKN